MGRRRDEDAEVAVGTTGGGTVRGLVIASRTAVRERGERLAKLERFANRDSGDCAALWSDSNWIGRGDSIPDAGRGSEEARGATTTPTGPAVRDGCYKKDDRL